MDIGHSVYFIRNMAAKLLSGGAGRAGWSNSFGAGSTYFMDILHGSPLPYQ